LTKKLFGNIYQSVSTNGKILRDPVLEFLCKEGVELQTNFYSQLGICDDHRSNKYLLKIAKIIQYLQILFNLKTHSVDVIDLCLIKKHKYLNLKNDCQLKFGYINFFSQCLFPFETHRLLKKKLSTTCILSIVRYHIPRS